jgi:hypothetical protein
MYYYAVGIWQDMELELGEKDGDIKVNPNG